MSTMRIALLLAFSFAGEEDRPSTMEMVDGSAKKGVIKQIDDGGITLLTPEGSAQFPLDQVIAIDVATPRSLAPSQCKVALILKGGGLLFVDNITSDDRDISLILGDRQPTTLPIASVRGILFGPVSPAFFDEWKQNCEQPRSKDVLLADKGGEQAELEGTIGKLAEERISFTVDGEAVDVRRERVRALYFANAHEPIKSPISVLEVNGNRWPAQKIEWNNLGVTLTGESIGSQLRQHTDIARIDFSTDRLTYLSDLKSENEEHIPYFDTTWPIAHDRNFSNGPIRIGGNTFRKGLVVHSKTMVRYPLHASYRRLQLTAGLEQDAGPLGKAVLQFLVDEKLVKELIISADSAPIDVEIDVENARHLTIVVDYGLLADLGDHVALGNARLLK